MTSSLYTRSAKPLSGTVTPSFREGARRKGCSNYLRAGDLPLAWLTEWSSMLGKETPVSVARGVV